LPYGLLAALLLTTGAAIAALGIPNIRTAPDRTGQKQPANPPRDCTVEQTADTHTTFFATEIALERRAQRLAEIACAASPSREANEQKDRNWAELMARVNHELRTPLNAVIGFSDMMALKLFGPVGDPRYEDYIRHIRDSANELLKSAEDTMALTALVAHPSACDGAKTFELEELAREAWAFLSAKAPLNSRFWASRAHCAKSLSMFFQKGFPARATVPRSRSPPQSKRNSFSSISRFRKNSPTSRAMVARWRYA
jgi:signal transduction histidine kinase